jgi:hypothetical protein
MTEEEERLRRELRALAAVNRQLQVQLEEPGRGGVARHRRASTADVWIGVLATRGKSDAHLVQDPDGAVFVVEGTIKRAVRSGILGAALAQALGLPRRVSLDELSAWDDGIPVELFESPNGTPFMVIAGERRHVRGVPLTYPVDNRQTSELPQGPDINVAAANVARYRVEAVGSGQVDRVRNAVQDKGLLGTARAFAGRAKRRVKKALGS